MNAREQGSTTLEQVARKLLSGDSDTATRFIRQQWLSRVVDTLRDARREAGLTQEELASRLRTTQSAIARLENDATGGYSVRRVVDYLVACGQAPFEISYVAVPEMREFALSDPTGRRTELRYTRWRSRRSQGDPGSCRWRRDRATDNESGPTSIGERGRPRLNRGLPLSPTRELRPKRMIPSFAQSEWLSEETSDSIAGFDFDATEREYALQYAEGESGSGFASVDNELAAAVA